MRKLGFLLVIFAMLIGCSKEDAPVDCERLLKEYRFVAGDNFSLYMNGFISWEQMKEANQRAVDKVERAGCLIPFKAE